MSTQELAKQAEPRKLISFSLYGLDKKYRRGMIENIRLAPIIYPGWQVILFHDGLNNDIAEEVDKAGGNSRFCGDSAIHLGMFWRFLAAGYEASHIIFRDVDSRLNTKEADAVADWIHSGKLLHCMHDHRYHSDIMQGGMWGVVGGQFNDIRQLIIDWTKNQPQHWGSDQHFLRDCVWSRIGHSCLRHSSVPHSQTYVPFPSNLADPARFVGEQFDANNQPIIPPKI